MRNKEFVAMVEKVEKARAAIVEHVGPWKRGTGVAGAMDCPICGKPQSLRFHQVASNGHIHAKCQTEACVSWME